LILRTKGRLDDLSLIHGIRGTGNLDLTQLEVMCALFLWRDAKARALDRPCGSIISNERLVKIARALDANVARRYAGLQPRSLLAHTPQRTQSRAHPACHAGTADSTRMS
jgi:ribonuclease D